jgi:hypothetical protein
VGDANEAPLVSHLIKAAQEKLPEAARLFDLAENRLGQLLAKTIATSVAAEL